MSTTVLDRDMQQTPGKTRPTKRIVFAAGLLVLAAGTARVGFDWWTNGRFIESTDDAYVGGNVTTIAPHAAGFIDAVLVADHEHVHAGQVLIRLDRSDYQEAVARAEAVVSGAGAALGSLQAQLAMQQSTIDQQAAELVSRSAQADYASADAARYRSLATTAAGSRQEQQRTASLDAQARAAVLSSSAGLQAARQRVAVLRAEILKAEAALAQARSELQTARLTLGYTEIRSPIDGYVGNRAAQVGAYVPQGGYLLSVIPAAGLWVDANFKEDQLGEVAPGRSVTVTADVLPGHVFRGRVASLSPGTGAVFSVIPPENATGNFTKVVQRVPVRIALDADPKLAALRPGLSTVVRVDTRSRPTATP